MSEQTVSLSEAVTNPVRRPTSAELEEARQAVERNMRSRSRVDVSHLSTLLNLRFDGTREASNGDLQALITLNDARDLEWMQWTENALAAIESRFDKNV